MFQDPVFQETVFEDPGPEDTVGEPGECEPAEADSFVVVCSAEGCDSRATQLFGADLTAAGQPAHYEPAPFCSLHAFDQMEALIFPTLADRRS